MEGGGLLPQFHTWAPILAANSSRMLTCTVPFGFIVSIDDGAEVADGRFGVVGVGGVVHVGMCVCGGCVCVCVGVGVGACV